MNSAQIIKRIESLYAKGDYQQARELCRKALFDVSDHELANGIAQKNENAVIKQLERLEKKVVFEELYDYLSEEFNHRKFHRVRPILKHFAKFIELLNQNANASTLLAHIAIAPTGFFHSHYKYLLGHVDIDNIRSHLDDDALHDLVSKVIGTHNVSVKV